MNEWYIRGADFLTSCCIIKQTISSIVYEYTVYDLSDKTSAVERLLNGRQVDRDQMAKRFKGCYILTPYGIVFDRPYPYPSL